MKDYSTERELVSAAYALTGRVPLRNELEGYRGHRRSIELILAERAARAREAA
ncbi:MAG: hypothetical protein ABR992_20535 [Solirubrobacteraceae bacterium]|jgi:hypothetical protein